MDKETLVLKFVAFLKANLNAKIAEISAKKNDGVTLDELSGDAYFYQELPAAFPNRIPFALISVDSETTSSVAGRAAYKVTVAAELLISDKLSTDSEKFFKVCSRYESALCACIEAYPFPTQARKVAPVPGVRLIDKTSSRTFYTVGVACEFSMAN